ncbi:hypothetical protein DMENIID0001_046710 [Sergentomyia squamirostris]
MEVTPEKHAETSRGSRHTPTPQMSERKRALFGRNNTSEFTPILDEDSDLGPMNPLRYSPVGDELTNDSEQSNFRNILLIKPAAPDFDDASNMSSVISDQAVKINTAVVDMMAPRELQSEIEKENCPEDSMKTPEVSDYSSLVKR